VLLIWSGRLISQENWQNFILPEAVSLRGVASFSAEECWVSGANGSVYRTTDGGSTWIDISPSGYESLDFRDIEVFDQKAALIVSAGYPSRILKTNDGGISWREVFASDDRRLFLDAVDFWDDKAGMVFGDAIGRHLVILLTDDQGEHWRQLDTTLLPNVLENQGGFAASGSCLQTFGDSAVIIGLGGPEATLLVSENRSVSWKKKRAPLSAGTNSSGIFSFSFFDDKLGLMAGGDYTSDAASKNSIALTRDGGLSWELITDSEVNGFYHSACLILEPTIMIAISRLGSSWSFDGGKTWQRQQDQFYSVSRFDGGFWASGPEGKVGRWLKP
jgi:photosystem II stability/assembly factor-like uncharacterized protein